MPNASDVAYVDQHALRSHLERTHVGPMYNTPPPPHSRHAYEEPPRHRDTFKLVQRQHSPQHTNFPAPPSHSSGSAASLLPPITTLLPAPSFRASAPSRHYNIPPVPYPTSSASLIWARPASADDIKGHGASGSKPAASHSPPVGRRTSSASRFDFTRMQIQNLNQSSGLGRVSEPPTRRFSGFEGFDDGRGTTPAFSSRRKSSLSFLSSISSLPHSRDSSQGGSFSSFASQHIEGMDA